MSIPFNPRNITSASSVDPSTPRAMPPAAAMMAPVDLTPLAPPSSASRAAAVPATVRDPGADARQAGFSGRQKALLERLRLGGAMPQGAQTGGLPEPQRNACLSVLAAVASAVAR